MGKGDYPYTFGGGGGLLTPAPPVPTALQRTRIGHKMCLVDALLLGGKGNVSIRY